MDNRTAAGTRIDNQEVAGERGRNGAASGSAPENPLSEREMDVAELLVTGASNNDIASSLVISPHTVKVHLRNIYEKLSVNSRTEASLILIREGWVQLPGVEAVVDPARGPTVEELPPPDPQPLADTIGPLFAWQRVYLVIAMAAAVASFLLPGVLNSRTGSPQTLLSDGPVAIQAQPVLAELPRWESRTPLTRPRDRFSLVAINDELLLAIGGESVQGQILDAVEAYDLRVNEWRTVSPLPVALSNTTATYFHGDVFVAGGTRSSDSETGTVSDLLWRYAPREDRWQAAGRLPVALAGTQLLADENNLFLLGGWDGSQMREEVWQVRPNGDAAMLPNDWVQVATLPSPRAFFGARIVGKNLYIAGGQDADGDRRDAHVYSLQSGEWRALPAMSTPRSGLSLLYDGLALFAVGGGRPQTAATLERYDANTNLWSNAPVPVSGEWRNLGAAADNRGRIFLAGGWSGGYLNVHLHYQSSFHMFLPSTRKDDGPASPGQ